jgi:hypothetical protein
MWAREIQGATPLCDVVGPWDELVAAFESRAVLVHGRNRYTRNMAAPHLEILLRSTANVWKHCAESGVDLAKTIRRYKARANP